MRQKIDSISDIAKITNHRNVDKSNCIDYLFWRCLL